MADDKKVPDAVITESAPGVIRYEQNPYAWAKNSGQNMPGIYQETITVGAPSEEFLGTWGPNTPKDALQPVLAVAVGDKYVTSSDPKMMEHMANILQRAKVGGVDAQEKATISQIIHDAADDGKLNGSVPNVLVNAPKGSSR